jgi:hypothetical protein
MNKLVKTVSLDKLGYEFLRSLNGLLDLTDRELELLSLFLDIQLGRRGKTIESIDSTANRKLITKITSITKDNLCRYIKMFREKGIFIREGQFLVMNKALVPILIGNKVVQITMILKIKENEE